MNENEKDITRSYFIEGLYKNKPALLIKIDNISVVSIMIPIIEANRFYNSDQLFDLKHHPSKRLFFYSEGDTIEEAFSHFFDKEKVFCSGFFLEPTKEAMPEISKEEFQLLRDNHAFMFGFEIGQIEKAKDHMERNIAYKNAENKITNIIGPRYNTISGLQTTDTSCKRIYNRKNYVKGDWSLDNERKNVIKLNKWYRHRGYNEWE